MKKAPLNFMSLSQKALFDYLTARGYDAHKPLLISFDGDKTVINRAKGYHFLSERVIDMFAKFRDNPHFIVTMNTGSDAKNYLPIKDQINHHQPNIFVAGRAVHFNNIIYSDSNAHFSSTDKQQLWTLFVDGTIPFLDVKDGAGNTFFTNGNRAHERYLGHHRPVNWFSGLSKNIIDIESDKKAEAIFFAMDILRVEIPFLAQDGFTKLIDAINQKNRAYIEKAARRFFAFEDTSHLVFIPAPTNKSRGVQMQREVASLRIICSEDIANKGLGLRYLTSQLMIPPSNVIYFGDSAEDKANDAIVKTVLPEATLIITDNGDSSAKDLADFTTFSIDEDGVPQAVDKLVMFQERYSLVSSQTAQR